MRYAHWMFQRPLQDLIQDKENLYIFLRVMILSHKRLWILLKDWVYICSYIFSLLKYYYVSNTSPNRLHSLLILLKFFHKFRDDSLYFRIWLTWFSFQPNDILTLFAEFTKCKLGLIASVQDLKYLTCLIKIFKPN